MRIVLIPFETGKLINKVHTETSVCTSPDADNYQLESPEQ